MFLVRRVCRTERVNAWKVADVLTKICNAYEEDGRNKATIYIGGAGTPAAEKSLNNFFEKDVYICTRSLFGS